MRGRQDWDWRSAILAERVREHPVDQVISVLRDFGALEPHLALTGLGQAARAALAQRVPPPVTLGLPAAEFLNILAGLPDEEAIPNWPGAGETTPRCPGNRSVGCCRRPVRPPPAGRISAIDLIDEALHLWREVTWHPMLATHARCAITYLEQGTRAELARAVATVVRLAADRAGDAEGSDPDW